MNFLADESAKRSLSIGLTNANAIVPDLVSGMQWSINEERPHFDECADFSAFVEEGKPVFNVEYLKCEKTNNNDAVTKGQLKAACNSTDAVGFSTIVKNINLDRFTESCNRTVIAAPSGGANSDSPSSSVGARVAIATGVTYTVLVCLSIILAYRVAC